MLLLFLYICISSTSFQLGGKITTDVDPTESKPKDVSVIVTLSKMMEKGLSLLTRHNKSGNATVDFFSVTDDFSFGKSAFVILLTGLWGHFILRCFNQFILTAKSRELVKTKSN